MIRIIVFIGEIFAGVLVGSLAIIADASEKLSDIIYISVSIFSVQLVMKRSNKYYSYGYLRAGVIGALLSSIIMWIIAGVILFYGIYRITNIDSEEINGEFMFFTALIGMIINMLIILLLKNNANEEEKSPQDLDISS